MKVVVAGSRTITDYDYVEKVLDAVLPMVEGPHEIVSGGARGVDSLGVRYAQEKELSFRWFPADWTGHGRAAGYIRNAQMADYGDVLVAIYDGQSKGTMHMINLAKKKGLEIFIIQRGKKNAPEKQNATNP